MKQLIVLDIPPQKITIKSIIMPHLIAKNFPTEISYNTFTRIILIKHYPGLTNNPVTYLRDTPYFNVTWLYGIFCDTG